MHTQLQSFLRRYLGVVAITLAPVVFTTFVSIPFNLQRHPGDLDGHRISIDAEALPRPDLPRLPDVDTVPQAPLHASQRPVRGQQEIPGPARRVEHDKARQFLVQRPQLRRARGRGDARPPRPHDRRLQHPRDVGIIGEVGPERVPLRLKEAQWETMFQWLSRSLQARSRSRPGEEVPLEDPTGPRGWGTLPS